MTCHPTVGVAPSCWAERLGRTFVTKEGLFVMKESLFCDERFVCYDGRFVCDEGRFVTKEGLFVTGRDTQARNFRLACYG